MVDETGYHRRVREAEERLARGSRLIDALAEHAARDRAPLEPGQPFGSSSRFGRRAFWQLCRDIAGVFRRDR